MELLTPRLRLRRWAPRDAAPFAAAGVASIIGA